MYGSDDVDIDHKAGYNTKVHGLEEFIIHEWKQW